MEKKQMNSIGIKVREARKRLKLNLNDLALMTGSSKSYLWELENSPGSNPSSEKVIKIASALKLSIDFLLDDSRSNIERSDEDNELINRILRLDGTRRKLLEKFLEYFCD